MNLTINNKVVATLALTPDDLDNETIQNWTEHNVLAEMINKMLIARVSNQISDKITKNIKGFAKPDSKGNIVESGYEVELYVFTREELIELLSTK